MSKITQKTQIPQATKPAQIQTLKMDVAVVGSNASGEPDLVFVEVICTPEQYQNGEHYDLAKDEALEQGYASPMVAADERDPLWAAVCRPPLRFVVAVEGGCVTDVYAPQDTLVDVTIHDVDALAGAGVEGAEREGILDRVTAELDVASTHASRLLLCPTVTAADLIREKGIEAIRGVALFDGSVPVYVSNALIDRILQEQALYEPVPGHKFWNDRLYGGDTPDAAMVRWIYPATAEVVPGEPASAG